MKKLRREILLDAIVIASNLCCIVTDSRFVWLNLIVVVVLFPGFLRRCRLAAAFMELDHFCSSIIADWSDEGRDQLWASITGARS